MQLRVVAEDIKALNTQLNNEKERSLVALIEEMVRPSLILIGCLLSVSIY